MRFCSFFSVQFFFDRSVADLTMLTIGVCLIVFCLKSFVYIMHCVTLIPYCDIALSYLFAKANKFLMSLLTPPPPLKNLAYAIDGISTVIGISNKRSACCFTIIL